MAAALEAFLGGTAVPGTAAAAAAAGVAGASAITSATAKANPNAIPYAPDAYASGSPPKAPPPFQPIDTDDEDSGTPMGVWAAGIAALAILAIAGFLVFRLLSGPSGTIGPGPSQVPVPHFVGLTLLEAQALANQSGLTVAPLASPAPSGVEPNTVIGQDPAGGSIDPGGTVADRRGRARDRRRAGSPEQERDRRIQPAGGRRAADRDESVDPVVPAVQVVTRTRRRVVVNKGTPIDYTLFQARASQLTEPHADADPDADANACPTPTPRRPRSRSPTTAA
jgi:hypothetical protein